jgi:hypothetical protein
MVNDVDAVWGDASVSVTVTVTSLKQTVELLFGGVPLTVAEEPEGVMISQLGPEDSENL